MAKKILVVDDEELVTKSLLRLLNSQGYNATVVRGGKEAVEKAKETDFDLIICDVRMPGMDGIKTIKEIRGHLKKANKKTIPELLITGYADRDKYETAMDLKVADYIYKPFDTKEFLDALRRNLEVAQEVQAADNKTLIDNFIKEQSEKNKRPLSNKTMPIIGWCNTYVPEEIIIAAGFLPYRIMGASIPLHLSKTYLSGNLCSSVQSILDCALNGDYKFLDGMIIGASTDATKRLYDAWIRYVNTPFCHLFDIPKFINEGALIHFTESIHALTEQIESHFNIKINNADIQEAILTCNKTRRLLDELNNLRKMDNPPITGQQFLEVCKSAMTSNKKDFNDSLEQLIRQIRPEGNRKEGFRILLTGSFQDQPWLLDIIEEKGGLVVCEDFCTRLRYFSGLVEEDADPIKAIAKRYLYAKPASASLVSLDQRAGHLLRLIKEFNIGGVIYYILKFDDPYLFEFPDMKEVLVSRNVPVLRIETEHNTSAMGQIMTRVQAFIETLKLAKLKRLRAAAVER